LIISAASAAPRLQAATKARTKSDLISFIKPPSDSVKF
jgi:hypothetical protein